MNLWCKSIMQKQRVNEMQCVTDRVNTVSKESFLPRKTTTISKCRQVQMLCPKNPDLMAKNPNKMYVFVYVCVCDYSRVYVSGPCDDIVSLRLVVSLGGIPSKYHTLVTLNRCSPRDVSDVCAVLQCTLCHELNTRGMAINITTVIA